MARVKNFSPGDVPEEMREHWDWVCAIDAYYYCDPHPLADMVKSEQSIPSYFKIAVSEIIAGEPKRQNKRAAAKLKLPAADRMKIAADISSKLWALDRIKYEFLQPISDRAAIEPIELQRQMEYGQKLLIQHYARTKNLHPETLENLLRDLRKKIEDWPNV